MYFHLAWQERQFPIVNLDILYSVKWFVLKLKAPLPQNPQGMTNGVKAAVTHSLPLIQVKVASQPASLGLAWRFTHC